MELMVKENKFYMLMEKAPKNEIRIYDEMKPAIAKIKSSLKSGVKSENIELLSVEVKGEKFEIKTISWDFIATELIKD